MEDLVPDHVCKDRLCCDDEGVFICLFVYVCIYLLIDCVCTDEADDGWDYALRDALYTACKTGDLQSLHTLLQLPPPPAEEEEDEEEKVRTRDDLSKVSTPLTFLNQPIDPSGFTLLHVASAAGQKGVVTLLMDLGCDPASK